MKYAVLLVLFVATCTVAQTPQSVASWDGFVQRGKVKVFAAGSGWSVNGESVSHTQEIYASPEMARYIFSRLKGGMRGASDVAPTAGAIDFKVTVRANSTRIAWVCGTDLHYLKGKSNAAVLSLLTSWGRLSCG